mgnify:FL=1
MALLTDKITEKDLENRLTEFGQFGIILNYMLDLGNVSVDDLEKIFFDTDIDRAIFTYQNVLTKVGESDVVNSFNKYKVKYPNNGMDRELYNKYLNDSCIKDIIGVITKKKRVDQTYVNTYLYLLDEKEYNVPKKEVISCKM